MTLHEEEDDDASSCEHDEEEKQHGQAEPLRGQDPSRPWHPILNPNKDDLLARWKWDRNYRARQKYGEVWQDCIEKIRAGTWTTRKEIAQAYGKSQSWATYMVQLMNHQGAFTDAELRVLLPGRYQSKSKNKKSVDTHTHRPTNQLTKSRNDHNGSNLQFINRPFSKTAP